MTTSNTLTDPSPAATDGDTRSVDGIVAAVRAVAERARHESVQRERETTDIAPLVAELVAAGLGRLRVPARLGGAEATVAELASLLVEVATAESNLVQIVRGHLGFIEFLRLQEPSPVIDDLLAAAGRGELFGPAASSRAAGTPGSTPGTQGTTGGSAEPAGHTSGVTLVDGVWLHDDGDGLRLSGAKYYTTGSLHADWINVLVSGEDGITEVVVGRHDPGVTILDDWSGFGQRFTASGTARFDGVRVRPDRVLPHRDPEVGEYLTAFYQLVHSATQAGITRRIADDAADLVRRRRRTYPLAAGATPQDDPQVLGVVGELASRAFAARAAVAAVGSGFDALGAVVAERRRTVLDEVVVASASAQVTNSRLVGEAAWLLFDANSASALDTGLALDRHWRNARAVSSHNPSIYKARLIGHHAVHGALPQAGLSSARSERA